jgi:hypothetical protein
VSSKSVEDLSLKLLLPPEERGAVELRRCEWFVKLEKNVPIFAAFLIEFEHK